MGRFGDYLVFWWIAGTAIAILLLVAFNLDNPLVFLGVILAGLFAYFYFTDTDPLKKEEEGRR